MAGSLGSGSIESSPNRPVVHFGSPQGTQYAPIEPATDAKPLGPIGGEIL